MRLFTHYLPAIAWAWLLTCIEARAQLEEPYFATIGEGYTAARAAKGITIDWRAFSGPNIPTICGHDVDDARDRYREFVAQGTGRPAPWKNLAGQLFLGNEAFLKRMPGMAVSHSSATVPRAQRLPVRPSPDAMLQTVATAHNLPKEKVLDRSSGRALKLAVYLLRRRGNLALGEVATLAGVSVSRVSQIQAEIEAEENDGRPADVLMDVN